MRLRVACACWVLGCLDLLVLVYGAICVGLG